MRQSLLKTILLHFCLTVLGAGCSSVPERNPLPENLSETAQIPNIEGARYWADAAPPDTDEWLSLSKTQLKQRYPATFRAPHNYLAISGGGQNGAFGAGLLNGWTEAGTRPEFTMVTGISTGALIAPFAYLGPDYDHVIKEIYTTYSTKDIVEPRGKIKAMTGDAATDSTPLQQKLAEYVDEDVMTSIAAEYKKGRILEIVTTNLDAGRPVAWDIGKIAAAGSPQALQLIRDIMLASASIPAAFPPVMFDVEADGKLYDELHVDGGATSVLYLYPIGLDWDKVVRHLEVEGRPNVYTIRNGRLDKAWSTTRRSTIPIAMRTIDTLFSSIVQGDIYRIYLATQRDGINYHLAYIPESFDEKSKEAFDREYMTRLFDLGFEMAKAGFEWHTTPPGYDPDHK